MKILHIEDQDHFIQEVRDFFENKNEIILGKIVDISKESPVFVLIPIKNKDIQYQIKTDAKTEIIDQENQYYCATRATSE